MRRISILLIILCFLGAFWVLILLCPILTISNNVLATPDVRWELVFHHEGRCKRVLLQAESVTRIKAALRLSGAQLKTANRPIITRSKSAEGEVHNLSAIPMPTGWIETSTRSPGKVEQRNVVVFFTKDLAPLDNDFSLEFSPDSDRAFREVLFPIVNSMY